MNINKNISKVREEFPVLKYKTYLNSAAHGQLSKEFGMQYKIFGLSHCARITIGYALMQKPRLQSFYMLI